MFEPHSHPLWSRDEDHLAHISELLGPIPPEIFKRGKYWKDFFHKVASLPSHPFPFPIYISSLQSGRLLRIPNLRPWALEDVLGEKYKWQRPGAMAFAEFLVPLLAYEPDQRMTAAEASRSQWLEGC